MLSFCTIIAGCAVPFWFRTDLNAIKPLRITFFDLIIFFYIHPSNKVTQHDFHRLYFFILDFYSSSVISLESLFICLLIDALYVRIVSLEQARAGLVNRGQYPKIKVAKWLIGLYGKCMLCEVFRFPFVTECTRGYSSFIVLFSSNDMLKLNTRVSASGIAIFPLNFIHFPWILLRFLWILWISE